MTTKRQKDAFCSSCNGFEKEDCKDQACPFYSENPYGKLLVIPWWELPKTQWKEAEQIARREKRLIPRKELSEAQLVNIESAKENLRIARSKKDSSR